MKYRTCGGSGLKLPEISLGFWHNFGDYDNLTEAKKVVFEAFDKGVTHFDLANNYGPPYGSAETNFGTILKELGHRDEMVISTKAGYDMWPGPYGDGGSKKYLIASLDQSLKRMGVEYVDIFYHHRPDYSVPLEESMEALATAVRSGKALYVALSNYPLPLARKAQEYLASYNIHAILNQVPYNMLNQRCNRFNLFKAMKEIKMSGIVFSPLAQGLLTDKYLKGEIPQDSRANKDKFLKHDSITPELVAKLNALNEVAKDKGMKLSQLALAYILSQDNITSVIIGARNREQLNQNLSALDFDSALSLTENRRINRILEG